MKKFMHTKHFIFIFFYCLSTQFMLAMNIGEQTPLNGQYPQKKWTRNEFHPYGSWFQENNYTSDYKNYRGQICCRTHTPTIPACVVCCVILNVISPCNPSNCLLNCATTCLFDQCMGFCNQPIDQERCKLYELNPVTNQPQLVKTIDSKTFQTNCYSQPTQERLVTVFAPHPLHPQYPTIKSVQIQNEERK